MSSAILKKIQKNLLFRQINSVTGNVDESVAAAVLLGKLASTVDKGKQVFIVLPRLDNAEELFRQLKLWQDRQQLQDDLSYSRQQPIQHPDC